MKAIPYSNFRKKIKDYFKQVNKTEEPLLVTNKSPEEDIIILTKDDYDSLIETLEIQSNPYLRKKINAGRQEVENGNIEKIGTLDDLDKWIEEY